MTKLYTYRDVSGILGLSLDWCSKALKDAQDAGTPLELTLGEGKQQRFTEQAISFFREMILATVSEIPVYDHVGVAVRENGTVKKMKNPNPLVSRELFLESKNPQLKGSSDFLDVELLDIENPYNTREVSRENLGDSAMILSTTVVDTYDPNALLVAPTFELATRETLTVREFNPSKHLEFLNVANQSRSEAEALELQEVQSKAYEFGVMLGVAEETAKEQGRQAAKKKVQQARSKGGSQ